jgi:hypothetical protein
MCCYFTGRHLVVIPVTWKDDEVPCLHYQRLYRLESSPDIKLLDLTNGHWWRPGLIPVVQIRYI